MVLVRFFHKFLLKLLLKILCTVYQLEAHMLLRITQLENILERPRCCISRVRIHFSGTELDPSLDGGNCIVQYMIKITFLIYFWAKVFL
jgi:hypothetical protein